MTGRIARRLVRRLAVALLVAGAFLPAAGAADTARTGFLVATPDRGFLGNEETRDAIAAVPLASPFAALFVTDERTGASLDAAVARLRERGAERVVVLPLFVSRAHPGHRRLEELVAARRTNGTPLVLAAPWGESYYAVETLADRLREVADPAGSRIVVLGPEVPAVARADFAADLGRLAADAAQGFGFAAVEARTPEDREDATGLDAAEIAELRDAPGTVVVPFAFDSRLDPMMARVAGLRRDLGEVPVVGEGPTPTATIALWLEREARRHLPLEPRRVGVLFLAHGSDVHWNDRMREAIAPLAERALVEPVFTMADQSLIARGIRRLEARGAAAVVVVRVFGLESSFRATVERMLGMDVERRSGAEPADGHGGAVASHGGHGGHGSHGGHGGDDGHGGHGSHGGHGAHGTAGPPRRILTGLPTTTVGGLEDHPLFARALLDRIREISEDPARETVVLVAHGMGSDERDAHWHRVLESLVAQIRAAGGDGFRAFEVATWREDWPDEREASVARVRRLVAEAAAGDGRALVVPARTTGRGAAEELLAGLDFAYGHGFAPHPLFVEWVEAEVARGIADLAARAAAGGDGATGR